MFLFRYPDMREITRTYGTANNLASFPEETGIGENDMEQNGDDEEEEDSSIRRTVSTSSASSLRTAWASKQSLATADKTDLTPEPNMLRRHSVPKGHASKQFMSKCPLTRVRVPQSMGPFYPTHLEVIPESLFESSLSLASIPAPVEYPQPYLRSKCLWSFVKQLFTAKSKPKDGKKVQKHSLLPPNCKIREIETNAIGKLSDCQIKCSSEGKVAKCFKKFSFASLRKLIQKSGSDATQDISPRPILLHSPLPPSQYPYPISSGPPDNDSILLEQISDFCDRDLLYRMSDQECELLWHLREDCKRALPNALNKLLLSFKWNNQKSVAQALSLLQDWPKIPPSKALELLDYAYADSHVRKYAIECLKGCCAFG